MRRCFSVNQKVRILTRDRFKCRHCRTSLTWANYHADHVIPYSLGGETVVSNGQALCADCNRKKGASMVKLLPWQNECLQKYKNTPGNDFVLVAGTGCGKTTAGAAMAQHAFSELRRANKKPLIFVACPYRSIKDGWESAFSRLGLYTASKKEEIADDIDVIVSTYAGAERMLYDLHEEVSRRVLILILDEFHHLEEKGEWAKPYIENEYNFEKRIFLSGTPWRENGSFNQSLVRYDENTNEVIHDFTHPYGQNVNLQIEEGKNTVEVMFHPYEMEVDIEKYSEHGDYLGSDKVNTTDTVRSDSISPFVRFDSYLTLIKRNIITDMIDAAVSELETIRLAAMPRAAGIVFVSGEKEGRAVVQYLRERHDKNAIFVFSQDPQSHSMIDNFKRSNEEWIVAIDQVSEGTDIPRLNVAVDLSFKLTLMHIIQRWGRVLRLLRKSNGDLDNNTEAAIFFVAHAQLKYVAEKIEDEIKRNKRKTKEKEDNEIEIQKVFYKPVGEEGGRSETIFKGKTIEERQWELAQWLFSSNYGGMSKLGFGRAVDMASVFMATNTIPSDFFSRSNQDAEKREPCKKALRAEIIEDTKKATGRIAFDYFGGDFSSANQIINRKMGVSTWTKDKKTLEELEYRLEVVEALESELKMKAASDDN